MNRCYSERMTPFGLISMIENGGITPFFQPIVDLESRDVFGYEILSRGRGAFTMPADMFAKAEQWDLGRVLEYACFAAALKRISSAVHEIPTARFFINMNPGMFRERKLAPAVVTKNLSGMGTDPERIVFELTETAGIGDYRRLSNRLAAYRKNGFSIALDDVGAGYNGLIALTEIRPEYLKLDRKLIAGIHADAYKRDLVSALVTFARRAGTVIIAEGLETPADLQTVHHLGIRYAQGFILACPVPVPERPSGVNAVLLADTAVSPPLACEPPDRSISEIVEPQEPILENSVACETMDGYFRSVPGRDHVVIVDAGMIPRGLVTRRRFYAVTGTRFGYTLYRKKFVDEICSRSPIVIGETAGLRALRTRALERPDDEVYDPVIVVDGDGKLKGSVSMKQVIARATDIEIQAAACSNPLTRLPGNLVIANWMDEVLRSHDWSVLYIDLNHFKEFNDTYGFLEGDEAICGTSRFLARCALSLSPTARLGHIGGDDFILLLREIVDESKIEGLCERFDTEAESFFPPGDVERRGYYAADRGGSLVHIPLLSFAVAVVTSKNFRYRPHPGMVAHVAALLKKNVKSECQATGRSAYRFERRHYDGESVSASAVRGSGAESLRMTV